MCVEWNCHRYYYFFLFFHLSSSCLFLFCLLVLPYYVVNKDKYDNNNKNNNKNKIIIFWVTEFHSTALWWWSRDPVLFQRLSVVMQRYNAVLYGESYTNNNNNKIPFHSRADHLWTGYTDKFFCFCNLGLDRWPWYKAKFHWDQFLVISSWRR